MVKVIDEIGNRHGRLIVISAYNTKRRGAYWECICDCGNKFIAGGAGMRAGRTKSCGCSYKRAVGEASFNVMFNSIKNKAKVRGYAWNLTESQVREITSKKCSYCGKPPSQLRANRKSNGYYFYNGIDRVDNTRGYEFDNCVPCCFVCNRAKSVLSIDDFKEWVISIYNHWAFH
jgi:hypothetical protein